MSLSTTDTPPLPLPDDDFRLFAGFIEKWVGLQFYDDQGRASLEATVHARMKERAVQTPLEYYDVLRQDPRGGEFRALLELLVNNETSFFRNLAQFQAFQGEILPRLIESRQRTDRALRIWCAGCATGEEPYSVVMVLLEVLPFPDQWQLDVQATDISQRALWSAQRGVYSGRTFRSMPPEYRGKYITHRPDGTEEVAPEVRKRVQFRLANILDDPPPFAKPCDIIFCRNVLIYFRPESIRKALTVFYGNLASDGYLFVGHSEHLTSYGDNFHPQQIGDTFVYVKNRSPSGRPTSAVPRDRKDGRASGAPSPSSPGAPTGAERHGAGGALEFGDSTKALEAARQAFRREHFAEAEAHLSPLLADTTNTETHVLMACICASRNREKEALRHAQIALDANYLCAESHYVAALIHQGQNRMDEATLCLKRAIYSNNRFPLPHFQMARICQEQGDARQGLRYYQSTLKALEEEPEQSWEDLYAGLSAELIRRACVSGVATCRRKLSR